MKRRRVALVDDLDARQPLDVGHPVPARGDQAQREAVLGGQRRAVHVVAEQVVAVQRVLDRHAAGELLGDGQVERAGAVGDAACPCARARRSPSCRGSSPAASRPRRRRPRWPSSQEPARSSSGASGVPAQRALPTAPMRKGRPVLPEHSRVKVDLAARARRGGRPSSATAAARRGRRCRARASPDRAPACCSGDDEELVGGRQPGVELLPDQLALGDLRDGVRRGLVQPRDASSPGRPGRRAPARRRGWSSTRRRPHRRPWQASRDISWFAMLPPSEHRSWDCPA